MWSMSAADLFDAVERSNNVKQELNALKSLEEHLLCRDTSTEEQNATDEDYLHSVSLGGSSGPEKFFNQQVLNRFVCYVFVRRFGWSEVSDGISSGRSVTDPEHKSQINELLGNILHWFQDNEASSEVLTSLIYTLKEAQSKPVVRSQTVIHIMDLLRQAGPNIQSNVFDAAKSAIILSLTDVWSPIRSACISRLGYVIEHFTIQQLHVFFNDLIDICRNTASTWQATEGAVMGINTVIRKFQWIGILPDSDVSEVPAEDTEETGKCEFILKFGTSEFSAMPEFISIPLEDVIYSLLANTQLSIRENAIKCYSAYLGRCELKVAVRTLTELVSKLNPAGAEIKNKALFFRQFVFLSDFEAEGLLGVCVYLVKQIPSQHLLPLWTDCSPVFSMYLGHTACTVRQVSSTIFKFIVAKNSSSPDILKSVLHDLCHQWIIDMAFLSHEHSSVRHSSATAAPYSGMQSRTTLKKWLAGKRDGTKLAQVWEWREGRLLAYELILQFLIKNHWLYTFGSANLGPLSSSQDTEELHSSDNMANPADRFSSRGSGRVFYHSMKADHGSCRYESHRRSSCSSPTQDVYIERPRTSSESVHASSQPVDVPTKHCDHNVHCSHHRLGSTSTGGSLGSTHEVRLGGRMPTVYGCGASSIKSYGRHYSYYTKSKPGDKTTTSQHNHTACSLLALCLDTEKHTKLALDDGGGESFKKTMLLSDVLRNILLQCIESVADARWELRRMGQQLLPCVVEVMRWYDAAVVEDFINRNLQPSTSLLSYGACICLMHSLMHVARLQQLLQEPPSSWQDVHLCQQLIHSVISCIRHGLPSWLKIVLHLLQRPVIDHLTVVSMETVMISVGNFDFSYKEKSMMTKCVLERLIQIYAYHHPKEELSDYFKLDESNQSLKFITEGFLRAGASTGSTTLQFEKYLLTQIHPVLNQFTEVAPINEVVTLLPLATAWFGLYMEDDTLLRHLMDCIFSFCKRISLHCDNNETIDNKVIESNCTLAFQQVIKLILNKSVDHQSVRQVLDLCLAFLTILSPDHVVRHVLHAVASRLMSESKPNSATLSNASGNDKDLYLQSNDVNMSGTQIEESPPSDEDDHLDFISDGPMPETQMLNVSGNSSHSVSSHQRSRCNSGDDHQEAAPSDSDSSDWDDWDNEEEDISGLQTAVCEFLSKLQSKLTNIKQETLLHHHLQYCTDEERSILQSLIK